MKKPPAPNGSRQSRQIGHNHNRQTKTPAMKKTTIKTRQKNEKNATKKTSVGFPTSQPEDGRNLALALGGGHATGPAGDQRPRSREWEEENLKYGDPD